jgi:hypothetical protein
MSGRLKVETVKQRKQWEKVAKIWLVVTRLDDPKPPEDGVRVHTPMKKHYRVPQSLVIEATKIARAVFLNKCLQLNMLNPGRYGFLKQFI